MGTLPVARLTEQDYLALERAADYKSEFVGGAVVAVSGKTIRTMRLAGTILSTLDQQLEGRDCAPFTSDLRMRTPRGDYFYPDVSVVCQSFESHEGNADVCVNPVVMVDVLPP
ncbi:MAG: Uma2 family endonuclease [Bryobacteraceae bacterium]